VNKLYSNLKYLRHTEQLEAWRRNSVVAPIHVRIKPINHCNHNCWYCAYRFDNLKLGEDMVESDILPKEKALEIVEDLIDMKVKAVTFSGGGEPLIYKPLPDVIERLAGGGIRVASLTNGANLKGRMAEAFARFGTWVRVSMDGWDNDSYVKAREARPGEFDQIIENMRLFVASNTKCVLGVCFIIDENNCAHIHEICRLLKDIGVNHVKLSGAIIANNPTTVNDYHNKFKKITNEQIKKAQALSDASFSVLDHYHDLDSRFTKDYTICPYLQYLTVIGADCRVYTCQDKAYTESGILGSIKDRSFKEFWFSEENRQAIYALNPSKSCGHHCVSNAKNLSILEFLTIDPDHAVFV